MRTNKSIEKLGTIEEQIVVGVKKALETPTVKTIIRDKVIDAIDGEKLDVAINKAIADITNSEEFLKTLKSKITTEIEKQIGGKIKDFVEMIHIDDR